MDGYLLLGPDSIDPAAAFVRRYDGTITYKTPNDDTVIEAGRLRVARFVNPSGLEQIGQSLYRANEISGEPEDWDPDDDSSIIKRRLSGNE